MARESTKFRTRKLDARRTLPVLRASQLKDLNDATTLTRTLTEVATGVEKEEEKELHLQAAISSFATTGASGVYIPTPDANQTIPEEEYLRLHPRRTAPTTGVATLAAKDSPPPTSDAYPPCLPRSLIRYSTQVEDAIGCSYNVDDEDAAWLHAFRDGFAVGKSAVLDSAIGAASAPAVNAAAVVSPPAKKRARTKSPASPQKAAKAATAAASAAAAADAPVPPRPALTDDLFERCMHVLEALMNDRTGWMLTTPGFEQELEQADLITITEALAAVQDRPDLAGSPSSPTSASFSSMASLSALPTAARDAIDPVEPVETPFNATALSEARAAGSAAAASALSHITLPLPSPATSSAAHVAWWLPHIYPWWSHRRRTRRNRPLAPIVRIEDPNPRNETDPYVCFRKRETKVMRKTRRSDAQAGTHLRKLRGELAMARALLALVHARESARTQVLVRDRSVFEARVQLRAVKRKLGVNDEKEFERPDYVPPSRATAAAVARAKAIAQAQALQAAALTAAAHAPAALATPNAGPATVKSRASSTTPLEAPARAPRASQPAARAAAAAGTVRGQPLVLPAGRGAAVDDMPSMAELLNRRVDDEFRRRKAAEEHFEDVSLFPKHILVGMPPPAVGASTTTPAPYVPPLGVTSRSGWTAAGQIMARQQRVATATSTLTATPSASATPTAPGTPVPLSTTSSVASLVAGPAAPMPPVPPYLPPSIAYPLAWRAYAAQLLVRGYPSPSAYPPAVPATDAPAIPPSASAVYSPGAWPSLQAYARLAPGQQHTWLYPYAARSAALAEARSLTGKLKPAESASQPTSPPTPAAPVLRHPLVHGPAVLTHPTLTGQSTVVLPLPTPEPAAVETTARSLAGSASPLSTAATTPTASTPSKTLVTRGPPSPSSSPLSNGAVDPPADPPLLMHPSMMAAARSASPAPPLSPASVLGEDPLAEKPVVPHAALMTAGPAVGPSPTTATPSDKTLPALPPGIGVGPSGQLFADWLGKDRMILDGDDDEADGEDQNGADEAMDVDGSAKGAPVATWIMRKRVGRNGRVFLERRHAPGTRWGNV
ncbi:hypothetical protein AMAG_02399 [Allomyces macrogynus ATCC 38327]|uniref:Enhancer of polycomb-like protein n=1 Tax=Allomyces macrogynus (strain ATCC 38327) TaxID=578462 RepID=A0A0L0S2M1_ALLM3|nr:hypothetical protein AMAG_02399 [Allomyces macrogynus ATCC 38327]|eukprot:KNE56609.1 hypothetical protein AMAG_02399 [Allomyces macrogynus ATCC 38327]